MRYLKYETLLDLAGQRLRELSRSPNRTREARQKALDLARSAERELASFNEGRPLRYLADTLEGRLSDAA